MLSRIKEYIAKKKVFFNCPIISLLNYSSRLCIHFSELDSRLNKAMLLEVPRGSTILKLFEKIEANGLIEINRPSLRLYSKFTEGQGPIKAGKYDLAEGMTIREIVKLLRAGAVVNYKATFPEGLDFQAMAREIDGLASLKAEYHRYE